MTNAAGPAPLSILIADDASVMRMLLRTMLSRFVRATVDEAPDGATALRMATEGDYGLVFLDINMPHMTGLAVVDALRHTERYKSRPVVLLTTLGQETQKERGMALGASAYMLKPLREMELVRTLVRLVPEAMGARRTK